MKPQVTVGIPAWNSAGTLRGSISSVLAQSFGDWELLILNDGSKDETAEVANAFEDPRIRVVHDETNRGLVYRLNQMIGLARAPLFARMDADDRMHPERLARQIERFRRDSQLAICGTAVYVMDEQECVYGIRGDVRRQSAGIRAGFVHPTVLGRTEWFQRNPYDAEYVRAEDTELWLRVDGETSSELICDPLLFYREPLTPQIAKYRTSCRTMRKLFRRYGPERFGRARTVASITGLYGKEWLYVTASRTGWVEKLVKNRNRECTPEEQACAQRVLAELKRYEKELHHDYSA